MSREENKIYVRTSMETVNRFPLPGLLIIKNLDSKALWPSSRLERALKEKIGGYRIQANFLKAKGRQN